MKKPQYVNLRDFKQEEKPEFPLPLTFFRDDEHSFKSVEKVERASNVNPKHRLFSAAAKMLLRHPSRRGEQFMECLYLARINGIEHTGVQRVKSFERYPYPGDRAVVIKDGHIVIDTSVMDSLRRIYTMTIVPKVSSCGWPMSTEQVQARLFHLLNKASKFGTERKREVCEREARKYFGYVQEVACEAPDVITASVIDTLSTGLQRDPVIPDKALAKTMTTYALHTLCVMAQKCSTNVALKALDNIGRGLYVVDAETSAHAIEMLPKAFLSRHEDQLVLAERAKSILHDFMDRGGERWEMAKDVFYGIVHYIEDHKKSQAQQPSIRASFLAPQQSQDPY